MLIGYFLCSGINSTIARSDESIHATVARELAFNGTPWWRPTFFGALYLNKPPLQFWGTAALLHIFGDHNFVYRIIPALSGLGVFLILFCWGSTYFGGAVAGFVSVFVALTGNQVLFDHGMRVATQDSTLLFLTLYAMYCFFRFLFEKNQLLLLYLGAIAVGFACLSKWVAGLLPFIILVAFCVITQFGREKLRTYFKEIIFAGFIAAVPATLFLVPHFLSDFDTTKGALLWNITERLFGKGYHHQDEWWHYLEHLIIKGSYGVPLLVLFALLIGVATIRDAKSKFLIIWLVVPLVLYSSLSSHLAWYFLPAAPAVWLLAGKGFVILCNGKITSRMIQSILGIILTVSISFGIYHQMRRARAKKVIPLDVFVETFRKNPATIDFSNVDISKDGALGLTRRQIFYLHRLESFSSLQSDTTVTIRTFDEIKDSNLRAPLCLSSENNKQKKLVCLFVHEGSKSSSPH